MPADHQREHEAKFEVSPSHLTSLLSQEIPLEGYTSQATGIHTHLDTYMDTPAYDLLRHGVALRVRRNGEVYETGIKSIEAKRKGAIQDRMDVTIPLPENVKPFDATTWPNAVEEHLQDFAVKLDEIRPILVVRQQRHKAHLSTRNTNKELAEWSLDEVWISLKDEEGSQPTHFHELEIELLAPEESESATREDESAFSMLVSQIQERYDLTPTYTSKLVRGLESAVAQAHDNHFAISAEMMLEAAGRLVLHQQLIQICLNEHGVRYSKSAKYVHDMRIAVRRALAALHLCQLVISRKTLAPHRKGLRRLGRVLGAVRDLDVAFANLRTFGRSLPEGQRRALKKVRKALRSRRRLALAELVELLDSKKHRRFIVELSDFCTTLALHQSDSASHKVLPSQVRHTIPSIIQHAFESVRCYEDAFSGGDLPALETFHALRIQTKKLRYLLEFTEHLLGRDGGALVAQLQGLQEHLGELNDARVEQERFHEWAKKAKKDEALGEAIAARLAQSTARIEELKAATPMRLHAFISPSARRKFATALAAI